MLLTGPLLELEINREKLLSGLANQTDVAVTQCSWFVARKDEIPTLCASRIEIVKQRVPQPNNIVVPNDWMSLSYKGCPLANPELGDPRRTQ